MSHTLYNADVLFSTIIHSCKLVFCVARGAKRFRLNAYSLCTFWHLSCLSCFLHVFVNMGELDVLYDVSATYTRDIADTGTICAVGHSRPAVLAAHPLGGKRNRCFMSMLKGSFSLLATF